MPQDVASVLHHDYEVTVTDCNINPRDVVDVFHNLLKEKGTRFLVKVPKGRFVDCLNIIKRIHSTFIFISLTVIEDSVDAVGVEPIIVKPLKEGEGG